jgi:hypothetical protein
MTTACGLPSAGMCGIALAASMVFSSDRNREVT